MTTMRRPRSDSTASLVAAARTVGKRLPQPPIALSTSALGYWHGVVTSRAANEWDQPSLFAGACLAQTQAAIVEESGLLAQEGTVVAGKANPRCKVIDDLHKRQMALLRALRLAGQPLGDVRDLVNARRLERNARLADAEMDRTDPQRLLARFCDD